MQYMLEAQKKKEFNKREANGRFQFFVDLTKLLTVILNRLKYPNKLEATA
jgi:hypothetical protein